MLELKDILFFLIGVLPKGRKQINVAIVFFSCICGVLLDFPLVILSGILNLSLIRGQLCVVLTLLLLRTIPRVRSIRIVSIELS